MKLGNVATGKDFFDRVRIREDIWRYLDGNHLILRGVRRLGKSSILVKIQEEALAKGLLAVTKDVGGAETALQFIQFLEEALPDKSVSGHLKSLSGNALEWMSRAKLRVEIPEVGNAELSVKEFEDRGWYPHAKKFEQRLNNVPAVIQIDEFSVFLEKLLKKDKGDADALLSWLRSWRVTGQPVCRFIFTGSIGINYLLESVNLTTRLNDCHEITVDPFLKKDAREMINVHAKRHGNKMSVNAIQYLCERTGWLSPFFLNLLFDQSMLAARDRADELELDEQKITKEDIDAGYERLLSKGSRFIHWEKRLSDSLTATEFAFCKDILSSIAKSPKGLTLKQLSNRLSKREADSDKREDQIRLLLNKLEDEGYLSPPNNKNQRVFLSFLLRDYWIRHYV